MVYDNPKINIALDYDMKKIVSGHYINELGNKILFFPSNKINLSQGDIVYNTKFVNNILMSQKLKFQEISSTHEELVLIFNIINEFELHNRRNYTRYEVDMPCIVSYDSAKIIDISVGGCKLTIDKELKRNISQDVIISQANLKFTSLIEIVGSAKKSDLFYMYNCKFVNTSETNKNNLISYIDSLLISK